jgi:hypothetical protein
MLFDLPHQAKSSPGGGRLLDRHICRPRAVSWHYFASVLSAIDDCTVSVVRNQSTFKLLILECWSETALFSDAHPFYVASKGGIIESSTECCSLNKCNSFIIETLLILVVVLVIRRFGLTSSTLFATVCDHGGLSMQRQLLTILRQDANVSNGNSRTPPRGQRFVISHLSCSRLSAPGETADS